MNSNQKLPWATIATIILAHEKNTFYIKKFRSQLNELLLSAFGQLFPQKHKKEIEMISDVIYYGTSTVSGSPTIGDQYADIIPVAGGEFPPKLWRRVVFLISHSFGIYGIIFLLRYVNKIKFKKYLDHSIIPLVHTALFYFDSCYYYIAYRIAGIRFKLMRKARAGEQDYGYAILGILSVIQLIIQTTLRPVSSTEREEEEACSSSDLEDSKTCMLCLSIRKQTVATPCGHLFCWYCIADWVTKKPECPLCRNYVAPPQLIPVHSFQ